MKKVIVLGVLLMFATQNLIAQQIHLIQIDFDGIHTCHVKEKSNCEELFDLSDEVKIGDYYQVVIRNINLNQYSVSINAEADTSTTKPFSTPIFSALPTDVLASLTSELTASVFSSIFGSNLEELNREINLNSMRFKNIMDPVVLAEKEDEDDYPVKEEKRRIANELNDMVAHYNSLSKRYSDVVYQKNKNDLIRARNYTNVFSGKSISDDNTELVFDHADNLNYNLVELDTEFFEVLNDYNRLININSEAIGKDSELKSYSEEIKKQLTNLKEALDNARNAISISSVLDEALKFQILEQNSDQIYVSLPNIIESKKTSISVTISPRDKADLKNTYTSSVLLTKPNNNYIGTGLSYYLANFTDENYSIKQTINQSDTTFSIVNENVREGEIGLASMLRIGTMLDGSERIGGHLLLGGGVSITPIVRPRILVGAGITFGQTAHTFAFDLGFIAGHTERLSKTVNTNDNYPNKPDKVTISELDIKNFLSIGYVYKFN